MFAVGLFLLSNLRADTPEPLIWLWMAVTGLGVGPTFAVFTLIVQNSVPVRQLGAATSNVTLFQQLGGTIGLAFTGTIFGSVMLEEVPRQMSAAGVPEPVVSGFQSGGSSTLNDLSRVGDLGASILSQVPEAFRSQVEPFIPAMVAGIHEAISIATASTFVVGIATSVLAALLVLVLLPGVKMGEGSEPAEAADRVSTPVPTAD